MTEMREEELQALYAWIDEVPLSRPKKNITRDFSDGVLVAEVVQHFLPKHVDIHNYSPANSTQQKLENWRTLNRKVFCRLNFSIPDDLLHGAASSKPGLLEFILTTLRVKIENFLETSALNYTKHEPPANDYYDPLELVSTHQDHDHSQTTVDKDVSNRHLGPTSGSLDTSTGGIDRTAGAQPRNYVTHTRIPLPLHGLNLARKVVSGRGTFSPSSGTLPPLSQHRGLVQGTKAFPYSNPQKRSKYVRPSRNPPVAQPRPKHNSADTSIKLAEKDQRILESQECIQFLQMKVTRLQHLVSIKDMKIDELKKQLTGIAIHNHRSFQRI